MIISYLGRQHVKLTVGDLTVSLGPVSKDGKGKTTRYGADLAFVSINHPDYNGVELLSNGGKEPFVIGGAGEYEVSNVFIKGFGTPVTVDGKTYQNTSYVFTLDGMRIVYLGNINKQLLAMHKELIDETDILFVPLSGEDANLSPYDAAKIAVSLEPKMVIPIDGNSLTLPLFLKEMSQEGVIPVEKLTLKKKDLDGLNASVVLFHEV